MGSLTINDLQYNIFSEDDSNSVVVSEYSKSVIPDIDFTKDGDIQDLFHGSFDDDGKIRIALTN